MQQDVSQLLPLGTLLQSFLPTAQPQYEYRFYFAYDTTDPVYNKTSLRDEVTNSFNHMVSTEAQKRGPSTCLHVELYWVHCNYSGKPSWAHNDAVLAAYNEGADYVLRINDDTEMPLRLDWLEAFIVDLRSRRPIPNLGVVGPAHEGGNLAILTHDFTHWTHVAVFGYHYPRSLPDWSSDDWITLVYGQFNSTVLMCKRDDVKVVHKLAEARYRWTEARIREKILQEEVLKGRQTVVAHAEKLGVTLS